jgi:hypothetical protein
MHPGQGIVIPDALSVMHQRTNLSNHWRQLVCNEGYSAFIGLLLRRLLVSKRLNVIRVRLLPLPSQFWDDLKQVLGLLIQSPYSPFPLPVPRDS